MNVDNNTKRSSIFGGEKRASVQIPKGSFDAGYVSGKTQMKQIFSAPSQAHSRITPGGQLFLCVMGSLISIAITIWLTGFSKETGWRRILFPCGTGLSAVMFIILTITTIRRAKHPPQLEPLPDLSQRRSTIGARVSKRSIGGPLVVASSTAGDDQALVSNEPNRPSLSA